MGVRLRVAVAGKMFDTANHAAILHTVVIHQRLPDHVVAVLAERAAVDDGVFGVVVDIDTGCEIKVDAHGLALFGDFEAHLVNQTVVIVGQGAECHLAGKFHAAVQTHGRAPLAIYGDEHRDFAHRLHLVGDGSLAHGAAFEEAHAAGLGLRNVFQHLLVLRTRARGGDAHNQQLRDFLLQGHFGEGDFRLALGQKSTDWQQQCHQQEQHGTAVMEQRVSFHRGKPIRRK